MIERDGRLVAIREEKDATAAERAIRRCNAGPMAIRGAHALALLDAVGCDNAQKEFYLTDLAEIAARRGLRAETRLAAEEEAMGVNDRLQLAAAEAAMQRRLRRKAMLEGATLVAPETVFLSADAVIGRDVTIEPHVVIGAGVTIGDGAVIHAFSHLEGAKVAGGAAIGPYARLRPGADIAAKAKVGNFVEIKASTIEAGAKVNHLTYIGDARVGAGTNIGAGTITCNYDGFGKYKTDIGAGAFIGSNSALVAPVKIGDGAYVGSGSVITKDVEADALAVGRGPSGGEGRVGRRRSGSGRRSGRERGARGFAGARRAAAGGRRRCVCAAFMTALRHSRSLSRGPSLLKSRRQVDCGHRSSWVRRRLALLLSVAREQLSLSEIDRTLS